MCVPSKKLNTSKMMKQNYKETRQASEAKPAHVESRSSDGGLTVVG